MSAAQKITLARALHALPLDLATYYKGHGAGRFPFITREGPEGRRTRELWVDIPAAEAWLASRGMTFKLNQGGGKN
jgi:hypothetical protein